MDRKGYTLVELLAVVSILAIITTLATVSYISIQKKNQKREYDNLILLIENAAINYAKDKNLLHKENCDASKSINDLITAGYLESDNGTINDPRDNKPISLTTRIKVKLIDNNYSAEFGRSTCP